MLKENPTQRRGKLTDINSKKDFRDSEMSHNAMNCGFNSMDNRL